MSRVHLSMAGVIFAMALSGTAQAQLASLLGGGGGDSSTSPESIVGTYVEGAKFVLKAQERLLTAIGKKEEAERAGLQADNLTTGATKQDLEDAAKTQTDSSKILEESFKAQGSALDAQSQAIYGQGLGSLGMGVGKYVALVPTLKSFKPSITSFGGATAAAAYVTQTLPTNASNLQSTLASAIDYGKSQGVEIPADATAALK